MVQIRVDNVVSRVHGANAPIHMWLQACLSYRQDGYMFSPAFKNGTWDGFVRLYNAPAPGRDFGKFLTGNLHRVLAKFAEQGIECEVVDERGEPLAQAPIKLELSDRYYQVGAEEAAVSRTRGVIEVATAGGKNSIAARIMGRLNQPCLFVAHRLNLVRQSRDEFKVALKQPVGILQGGKRKIERFNVATVQTLDSALWSATDESVKRFVEQECRLVIVDEVHHASSPQYRRVLNAFLAAYYRFGLSATSKKKEGVTQSVDMVVEGLFGRIIHQTGHVELAEAGYLAKSHLFFL